MPETQPETKTFLPACPEAKFADEAPVVPNIIANDVIREKFRKAKRPLTDLDGDQYDWFCNFADWWVRWFYRNDKHWQKIILGKTKQDPRFFLETWIGHWADAFLKEGPDAFMEKMRKASVGISPDPEWQPGGMLA